MANHLQESVTTAVNQTIAKTVECVRGLSEEVIRWKPSEEEWSIMQIIAHVAEAIPYWVGEIRSIINNPNEAWGRGITDEVRIHTVSEENINSLTVNGVLEELHTATEQVTKLLQEITDEQLSMTAPCRNPRFEGKTAEFIVNHLIVEHAEKHYGQIQRNLGKWEAKVN